MCIYNNKHNIKPNQPTISFFRPFKPFMWYASFSFLYKFLFPLLCFLMGPFRLFKKLLIEVGFAFSFTTHLKFICLKCLLNMQITLPELPPHNANSEIVIFNLKGHLRHIYVKCVVNMLRPSLKPLNMIKKGYILVWSF